MKRLCWVLLAGSLVAPVGCSEFVSTSERTTAVDVVGESIDSFGEPSRKSDIVGSALPLPDDSELLTDANVDLLTPPSLPDDVTDETEATDEPDVLSGLGTVKPVSLKTAIPDSDSTEE